MKTKILGLLAVGMLTGTASAYAVTYSYTGSTFTSTSNNQIGQAAATYTNSDSISGSFTLSTALAGGLVNFSALPAIFSFSDGHHTYDNNNVTLDASSYFILSTDVAGNITGWQARLVDFNNRTPFQPIWQITWTSNNFGNPNNPVDNANVYTCGSACNINIGSSSAFTTVIGSWQTGAAVVPEPGTLALLGLGLAGLGLSRRRKAA